MISYMREYSILLSIFSHRYLFCMSVIEIGPWKIVEILKSSDRILYDYNDQKRLIISSSYEDYCGSDNYTCYRYRINVLEMSILGRSYLSIRYKG